MEEKQIVDYDVEVLDVYQPSEPLILLEAYEPEEVDGYWEARFKTYPVLGMQRQRVSHYHRPSNYEGKSRYHYSSREERLVDGWEFAWSDVQHFPVVLGWTVYGTVYQHSDRLDCWDYFAKLKGHPVALVPKGATKEELKRAKLHLLLQLESDYPCVDFKRAAESVVNESDKTRNSPVNTGWFLKGE